MAATDIATDRSRLFSVRTRYAGIQSLQQAREKRFLQAALFTGGRCCPGKCNGLPARAYSRTRLGRSHCLGVCGTVSRNDGQARHHERTPYENLPGKNHAFAADTEELVHALLSTPIHSRACAIGKKLPPDTSNVRIRSRKQGGVFERGH